jgi:hypothetical protein
MHNVEIREFYSFAKYSAALIRQEVMGRVSSTNGEEGGLCIGFWCGNLKRRRHFEHRDVK